METFATAGIAGAFGRGFLSEAIRDTYRLVKNTATYQYPLIQATLLEIDLGSYLRSLEILLTEIEIDSETPAPIKYCYDEVINSIQNIKAELVYIQTTIEEHPKKWASYLRRPNYKKNLKRLRLYKVNCDRRLDLLMKSIQLHSRPSRTSSPIIESRSTSPDADINQNNINNQASYTTTHTPEPKRRDKVSARKATELEMNEIESVEAVDRDEVEMAEIEMENRPILTGVTSESSETIYHSLDQNGFKEWSSFQANHGEEIARPKWSPDSTTNQSTQDVTLEDDTKSEPSPCSNSVLALKTQPETESEPDLIDHSARSGINRTFEVSGVDHMQKSRPQADSTLETPDYLHKKFSQIWSDNPHDIIDLEEDDGY